MQGAGTIRAARVLGGSARYLVEYPRVRERNLAPAAVSAADPAVPGDHLGLQQHGSLRGRPGRGPQRCDPLRRLDVVDARVVETRGREDRRVLLGDDVLVGRVRL